MPSKTHATSGRICEPTGGLAVAAPDGHVVQVEDVRAARWSGPLAVW